MGGMKNGISYQETIFQIIFKYTGKILAFCMLLSFVLSTPFLFSCLKLSNKPKKLQKVLPKLLDMTANVCCYMVNGFSYTLEAGVVNSMLELSIFGKQVLQVLQVLQVACYSLL